MIAVLCVRDRGGDPSPVVTFGSTWQSANRYSTASFLSFLKTMQIIMAINRHVNSGRQVGTITLIHYLEVFLVFSTFCFLFQ